mmetsp:Transcript_26264/g.57455  ORF Transcript_26264/g.57455 Transcript_26264/m.57455 type:complete len:250 (-) Transcript_26264:29-778(-)
MPIQEVAEMFIELHNASYHVSWIHTLAQLSELSSFVPIGRLISGGKSQHTLPRNRHNKLTDVSQKFLPDRDGLVRGRQETVGLQHLLILLCVKVGTHSRNPQPIAELLLHQSQIVCHALLQTHHSGKASILCTGQRIAQDGMLHYGLGKTVIINTLTEPRVDLHNALQVIQKAQQLLQPFTSTLLSRNLHRAAQNALVVNLQFPATVLDENTDQRKLRFDRLNHLHPRDEVVVVLHHSGGKLEVDRLRD